MFPDLTSGNVCTDASVWSVLVTAAGTGLIQPPPGKPGEDRGEHQLHPHVEEPDMRTVLPQRIGCVAWRRRRDLIQVRGGRDRAEAPARGREPGELFEASLAIEAEDSAAEDNLAQDRHH